MKLIFVKTFNALVAWAEILYQYRNQTNRSGFY